MPFSAGRVQEFDPFVAPTLGQLAKELDAYQHKHDNDENADNDGAAALDWKKTSLKPYFEGFDREFLKPLNQSLKAEQRDLSEQEAAIKGDF